MFDFEQRVFDYTHRRKLHERYEAYIDSRKSGLNCFADYELASQQLAYLRYEAIENMEANLLAFEENFTKRGGKVIWAETAREACEAITNIIQTKEARKILKAKTATISEIGLTQFLEEQEIAVTETNLDDFILQTLADKVNHFTTPAQYLSRSYIATHLKESIPELFEVETKKNKSSQLQMFEEVPEISSEDISKAVSAYLRPHYIEAEIGITGANFLVADIGGVAITENEGNARLLATFPHTHIVVAGIDKIVPHFTDLALYWQMLSVNATGQRMTAYQTVYTGSRQADEVDGATEMYVILLDNGRTKMLADSRLRHALRCIKCGACANVCPVYRLVGGEAYQSPYVGAIGAVINPHLYNKPAYFDMSHASTLCGACEEVCPVQIDLPALLLHNRALRVQSNLASQTEKRVIKFWHKYMLHKKNWTRWNAKWKNNTLQHFFKRTWGRRQAIPEFVAESFHEQWAGKVR